MIEVAMPVGFGPGATISGGCVFESSLSSGVASRFVDREITIKALALDVATVRSEGIDLDPIGVFRLGVQKARFRDKLTNQIKEEMTLISPDFNNEPIGVWTDAGEHGTGTAADYKRIITRANQLAQTEGNASLFWLSPGNEVIEGVAPHRAYLWVKRNDNVTAYAYSLVGSRKALSQMMKNLGQEDQLKGESLEDMTIIRKNSAVVMSHQDIFQALASSLNEDEKEKFKTFLNGFRQNLEVPDIIREDKIRKYRETYEMQLKAVYREDIKSAIESMVHGFIALSESIKIQTIHINDTNLKAESVEESCFQDASIIVLPFIPGFLGLPRLIDDSLEKAGFNTKKRPNDPLLTERYDAVSFQTDAAIAKKTIDSSDFVVDFSDERVAAGDDWSYVGEVRKKIQIPEEHKIQAEFMGLGLNEVNRIIADIFSNEKSDIRQSAAKDYMDLLSQTLPFFDRRPNKADREPFRQEEDIKLLSDILNTLEFIGGLDRAGGIKEDRRMTDQIEVNETGLIGGKVARIGEELLRIFMKEEFEPLRQKRGSDKETIFDYWCLAKLSLLLHLYNNKDSSEKAKIFLAALIYDEMIRFKTDKKLPEFDELSQQTVLLEDKLFELRQRIISLFIPLNISKVYYSGFNYKNISKDILFAIFCLARLITEQNKNKLDYLTSFSLDEDQIKQNSIGTFYREVSTSYTVEKLSKHMYPNKTQSHFFKIYRNKKKTNRLPHCRVVFIGFHIIYQYRPLVRLVQHMTQ